jgi:hypothetical protein
MRKCHVRGSLTKQGAQEIKLKFLSDHLLHNKTALDIAFGGRYASRSLSKCMDRLNNRIFLKKEDCNCPLNAKKLTPIKCFGFPSSY